MRSGLKVIGSDAQGRKQQGSLASMEKWYVAHSKPRNEELLWKQYCLRDIESYYPCIKGSTVNPRARQLQPYFPGYLFVRADLELVGRSTLEWVPGAAGLVSFGDEPAFVPDNLIYSLKERTENLMMESGGKPIPLRKGDNVAIHGGVFTGYEGIFDVQLSGIDRVRVLLSLLDNRLIPVEMPASYVQLVD